MERLAEIIIGLSPVIGTAIICIFLRIVGVIREEHERDTKLTKQQLIKNWSWLIGLTIIFIIGIFNFKG